MPKGNPGASNIHKGDGRRKNQEVRTWCPQCDEPVYRWGQMRGRVRYGHRKSQGLDCHWAGHEAVGHENEIRTGVSLPHSKTLRSAIVKSRGKKKTYVITSAQNATPPWELGWKTLLNYCNVNDAQLLVIPYRYHNPTSIWSQQAQSHDWWHSAFEPYLITHRVDINSNLVLLADIMMQPTADRPTEGFENISGPRSCILGHPRLQMITVPTPQAKLPKIVTTTGSITRKNYIPSKLGKKGEFHHTFGAMVVEVDGEYFHMRQLNITRDGSFCDLLTEYDGDQRHNYDRISALVMGDTHVEVIDMEAAAGTFKGAESMVAQLKPEILVWHDVFDGQSINHHDRGRVFHEFVKHRAGRRNAEKELQRTLDFIDEVTPPDTKNVFVASNHNEFLREWVENTDPRKDPENVMFWAETFLAIAKSEETRLAQSGVQIQDPFAYWALKRLKCAKQCTFLRRGQSFMIKGIDCGHHGDKGPGGSVGSRESYRKIGVKTVIGHKHGPGIIDGCYQVGTTSVLSQSYQAGAPNDALHTHCLVYPNGKRSLANLIEGKWRGV